MQEATRKSSRDPAQRVRPHQYVTMAAAFGIGMTGTTLPTPLYPLYQHALHLSSLIVAVIFATYAFGVLAALMTTGPWSDQVGRRPVLVGALAAAFISSLLFLEGGSLWVLLLARAFSGLSAGLFTATATVAVVELAPRHRKVHAAMLAAAVNMGGLGLGPLLAGMISQYLPWPLHLVYALYLILLPVASAMVWMSPETVERSRHPHLRRQRLALPESVRSVFIPAAVACFAGFALLGLLTSLEPAILGSVAGMTNRAAIGSLIFLVFMASLGGQLLQRRLVDRARLPAACGMLALGAGLLAVSTAVDSMGMLVLGAVASGLGQGGIFAASIVAVTAASPDDQKAEVSSLLFVVVYLAVSIPVLGLGFAIDAMGLRDAGITFALLVLLLSVTTLGLLWRRHTHAVVVAG